MAEDARSAESRRDTTRRKFRNGLTETGGGWVVDQMEDPKIWKWQLSESINLGEKEKN